ncbi:MAG TPA: TM2 domain-containing protein [Candidatus Thioglobus sp.]|nr:TM2 domain-containing protein [Candidatus Thioglobus sp.]
MTNTVNISSNAASDRKYGIAVCLCAIFGLLGVHHFYLGRFAHGLLDLSMTIGAVVLFLIDNPLGIALLVVDIIHTLVITIMLLIGAYKDGNGNIVSYPGQFK